jgi:hypothetical protein
MKRFAVRFFLLFALLNLLLFATACTTAWTTEASNIIILLGPAITSALAILAAFGLGIPPTALTAIQAWSTAAQADLLTVKGLIDQYNAAAAGAKPGILVEIQTLIGVINTNLAALLPELHVTDAGTQVKIVAVFDAVAAELTSLLALLPVVQGKVTGHDEVKALFNNLKSAKHFRADFNSKAGVFGKQYEVK